MQVRTTMRPWEPVEVDGREYENLANQGLLVREDEPDPLASPLPDRARLLDEQREQAKAEVGDRDMDVDQNQKNEEVDARVRAEAKEQDKSAAKSSSKSKSDERS
jgi:hypothetical protein